MFALFILLAIASGIISTIFATGFFLEWIDPKEKQNIELLEKQKFVLKIAIPILITSTVILSYI